MRLKPGFGVTAGIVLALFITTAGCDKTRYKTSPGTEADTASFAAIKRNIIDTKCMTCHAVADPTNHHVDLSGYHKIVGSPLVPPLVVPGKPEESSLYTSIATGRMPKGGARLSETDSKAVYDWIKRGALEVAGQPVPPGHPPAVTGENGPCDRVRWGDDEPGYQACS